MGAGAQTRQQMGRRGAARDGEGLANALGWFSIGLGLAQLAAPRRIARLIGFEDDDRSKATMRAVGVREIVSGVGILSRSRPVGWVGTRVAGDAMDLAFLGKALNDRSQRRDRTAAATAAVVGITALDVLCEQRLVRNAIATNAGTARGAAVVVRKAITVNRPPDEVYRFWHDFENLPRFMRHVQEVRMTGDRRSHWKANAAPGMTVEWEAEVVEDRPNELIAWRSLGPSDVSNSGFVRFAPAPAGRGTEVIVELQFGAPGGPLGAKLAKLFREAPGKQIEDDLRAFKQVIETGEVLLSDATVVPGPHPAHPPGKLGPRISA
jgi:uncharacterized membrane protein